MKQNIEKMAQEENCVFCKIVAGNMPAKNIIEDDEFLVINDLYPKAPVHVLVIPKKHIADTDQIDDVDSKMMGRMFLVAKKAAKELGVKGAYQLHINTGKDAGQVIFHIHVHLMGGWKNKQSE